MKHKLDLVRVPGGIFDASLVLFGPSVADSTRTLQQCVVVFTIETVEETAAPIRKRREPIRQVICVFKVLGNLGGLDIVNWFGTCEHHTSHRPFFTVIVP